MEQIRKLGVTNNELSVLMRDDKQTRKLTAETGSTVVKGTATGVGAGAAVGALAGLAIGVSAFVIPGVGPVLIAGPLAGALGITGAATATGAATGAVSGGIIGALTGIGLSRSEAEKYEEAVRKGEVLVAVATRADTHGAVETTLEHIGARYVKTVGRDLDHTHISAETTVTHA
jgi:uncharacterized membrane protein